MAYTVDPTSLISPANTDGAKQGAEEFRALKGYISTLVGAGGFPGVNIFRKNAIIGGDFDINPWQRGVTFAAIVSGNYFADRFVYSSAGGTTTVVTASKTVDAPILGTAYKNKTMDSLVINCLQIDVTTADAAIAAGEHVEVLQRIEGYIWKNLAQVPTCLSFWHKHSKIGIYCVAFKNNGADRSYIAEYSQIVSNTWEFEKIAIPASPSAGTWDYTTGLGLAINFTIASGATFQTPANIWTAGNFLSSANQVNGVDTIGNKFRLAEIQFEKGTIPSNFEFRTFQEELVLCQRYYEKTFPITVAPVENGGTTGAIVVQAAVAIANTVSVRWGFASRKRANPTTITYNTSAANANWRDVTAGADRTVNVLAIDETAVTVAIGSAPVVANLNFIHATASAEL